MNQRILVHCILFVVLIVVVLNFSIVTKGSSLTQGLATSSIEELSKLDELNGTLFALRNELLYLHSHKQPAFDERRDPSEKLPSSLAISKPVANAKERIEREPLQGKSVLIFTMDSIEDYEKNSKKGGAAGELIVRKSLESSLRSLGCSVVTAKSDAQFEEETPAKYDIIIVDPWTWAAKGWVPKRGLVGLDNRVFVLDFFGSKGGLRGPTVPSNSPRSHLSIPPKRFLTAFGSPDNTFLGYFIPSSNVSAPLVTKRFAKNPQGVIWGKDSKHFSGMERALQEVAKRVTLISTSSKKVFANGNIVWAGHQSAEQWTQLLQQSRFLVGLGNPMLGPSAIDAISSGCMFLNPIFRKPVVHNGYSYNSQHPYVESLGSPYVCNYQQHSVQQLQNCIDFALNTTLQPFIPPAFTQQEHLARVRQIFNL